MNNNTTRHKQRSILGYSSYQKSFLKKFSFSPWLSGLSPDAIGTGVRNKFSLRLPFGNHY